MTRVRFNASQGGGKGEWKPLPTSTQVIEIDAYVEQRTSSGGHPNLHWKGHVVGGSYDGKEVHLWYTLAPRATWRLRQLLEATLSDEQYGIEETGEKDDRGDPVVEFEFEPEDLVGCRVQFDVIEGEYNGKPKNDFNNPQPVDDGPAKTESLPTKAAKQEQEESSRPRRRRTVART